MEAVGREGVVGGRDPLRMQARGALETSGRKEPLVTNDPAPSNVLGREEIIQPKSR